MSNCCWFRLHVNVTYWINRCQSGESLKSSPDYNPVKSLQGKVPGLVVTNSGSAGGSPTVRIRGVATTNADTKPLYVVDGMFIDNIDFINPNDITSIEVLKDPSSLAISEFKAQMES